MSPQVQEAAAQWVQRYKGGVWALNQWSTPGARGEFVRGYNGTPLYTWEGGPGVPYQMGQECRRLINDWCEELQSWHNRH